MFDIFAFGRLGDFEGNIRIIYNPKSSKGCDVKK
jgi:hypothetical protein